MSKAAIFNLMSLTSDFIKVYPKLREIIVEGRASYDFPKKYIAFRSASVRGKWFSDNYLSTRKTAGLKNCLLRLADDIGKEAGGLELNIIKSTAQMKEIGNNKNFKRLESLLPELLISLSKREAEYSPSLISLSRRLTLEIEKTNIMLENIDDDEETKPKQEKDDLLGRQNALVESIINSTLAGLDGKTAHRIRTLLAKSDDKLAILQREMVSHINSL